MKNRFIKVIALENLFNKTYGIGEVFKAEIIEDQFFKFNPNTNSKENITNKVEVFR